MKKLIITPQYKERQERKQHKNKRKLHKKNLPSNGTKRKQNNTPKKKAKKVRNQIKPRVVAPANLLLLSNTESCLLFFRNLRSDDYLSAIANLKYVIVSLEDVVEIDYGTISILTAINEDMKYKGIILRTFLPNDMICKQFMIESGY